MRAGDDALATDNAFHFVVSPAQPVRVIVIDRGGTGGGALYLTRALAIGDAPRFETVARQPDTLSDDDLRRTSVILLNDIVVPAALARRLQRFVEGGGGLFVAVGSRATWSPDVDVLPAALEAPVDRTRGDAARIGALEYGHPVFEPFRAPRSGDFATARIYGYRTVTPAADAQVLARFDGGAPALVERRIGAGRVLLWTSTLDLSWSDFPLKPVYLPFVHRAARHLASYSEPAPWLTVGQVLDTSLGATQPQPTGGVVLTPSGRRVAMDEEGAEALELTEQGFYELRAQSGDGGQRRGREQRRYRGIGPDGDGSQGNRRCCHQWRRGGTAGWRNGAAADSRGPGAIAAAVVVRPVSGHPFAGGRHVDLQPDVENLNEDGSLGVF